MYISVFLVIDFSSFIQKSAKFQSYGSLLNAGLSDVLNTYSIATSLKKSLLFNFLLSNLLSREPIFYR